MSFMIFAELNDVSLSSNMLYAAIWINSKQYGLIEYQTCMSNAVTEKQCSSSITMAFIPFMQERSF